MFHISYVRPIFLHIYRLQTSERLHLAVAILAKAKAGARAKAKAKAVH